jgi:signal peptidase I
MTSAARLLSLLASILFAFSGVAKASGLATAPASAVPLQVALADAMTLASLHDDSQVLRVSGSSMHPFFGDGALLVIKPIDESRLRAGMVVVYRNRFNETIAHRLIARTEDGWVAQGYNNGSADSTPVNASNLVGVVYATIFSANDSLATTQVSLPVALAAPAR